MATDYQAMIDGAIGYDAVRDMMIRLVRTPSPQTDLMEAEPRILAFIRSVVEPELRTAGVDDIRYDPMGNLIARLSAGRSGRRVMILSHAMNAAPSDAASAPEPITTAAEAETLIGHLLDVMDALLAKVEEETALVRSGRLSEAAQLETAKSDLTRFIAEIGQLQVTPDTPAKVVIDESVIEGVNKPFLVYEGGESLQASQE